jgi:hypothetical protein
MLQTSNCTFFFFFLQIADYYGELISFNMSLKPPTQLLTTTAVAAEEGPSYTTTLSPVYNSCGNTNPILLSFFSSRSSRVL